MRLKESEEVGRGLDFTISPRSRWGEAICFNGGLSTVLHNAQLISISADGLRFSGIEYGYQKPFKKHKTGETVFYQEWWCLADFA
jgi:hypothetical protein